MHRTPSSYSDFCFSLQIVLLLLYVPILGLMSIHGTSFECGYEPEVVEDTAAPAVLMRRVDVW